MSKKQLIMERALELFAKQGFEATSVQQITDYCGISKGAFYLSFKSKDELILALFDHFMQQITIDIDYSVTSAKASDKLYHFFLTTFQTMAKHTDFVKLLINEQKSTLNKELLSKLHYYDLRTDQTILSIIEDVYGDTINSVKYDLIYTIKGLMNSFSPFIFFNKFEIDIDLVSRSLVEKTNLLATQMTTPFITEENIKWFHKLKRENISEEYLHKLISSTLKELEDSIERESLLLLKDQLSEQTFHPAIIKGLIENIKKHPNCKWLAFQLTNYFKQEKASQN